MQKIKWCGIAFAIGAVLGAGLVLFTLYRPASATITELRDESDRAAEQYHEEVAEYSDLLAGARGRTEKLAEALGRAEEEHQADIERVARLEEQAHDFRAFIGAIQELGGRASEYNQAIRNEAESALRELQEYREAVESSPGYSGERDPPAED